MAYTRCGYAPGIFVSMGEAQPCKPEDDVPWLEEAEARFGLSPGVIELVSQYLCAGEGVDTDEVHAAGLCAVFEHFRSGHASFEQGALLSILEKWCEVHQVDQPVEKIYEWLSDIEGNDYMTDTPERRAPIYFDRTRAAYTTPRMFQMQSRIAKELEQHWLKAAETIEIDESDPDLKGANEAQINAVRHFGHSRLTVVTGGPGTGKTSKVVYSILKYGMRRILSRHGGEANFNINDKVILTAPTGKAAQRMKEAIRDASQHLCDKTLKSYFDQLDAKTIHRTLSFRPDSVSRYGEDEPLDAELIIVDEASMLALNMAYRLFEALSSNPRVRLVLVGDPEQLPPVDVGELLSNFTSEAPRTSSFYTSLKSCRVHLNKNYRIQAIDMEKSDNIYVVQGAVIRGDWASIQKVLPKGVDDILWQDFEYCDDMSQMASMLEAWVARMLSTYEGNLRRALVHVYPLPELMTEAERAHLDGVFKHLDSGYRVLTPVNQGVCGTVRLNEWLGNRLGVLRGERLSAGNLVMLTQNQYEMGHFNGETGLVVKMGPRQVLYVAFPSSDGGGRYDFWPLDLIDTYLDLAFAISIHKSQGSEYEHGLIILPPQPSMLLTRNLLYTAISRTKRSATLLGKASIFRACVETKIEHDPVLPDPDML